MHQSMCMWVNLEGLQRARHLEVGDPVERSGDIEGYDIYIFAFEERAMGRVEQGGE